MKWSDIEVQKKINKQTEHFEWYGARRALSW